MAKRVLSEIMTDINAKKSKRIGKKAIQQGEEGTGDSSWCQPEVNSKTPEETVTEKATRPSLVLSGRKGRTKLLRGDFLSSSEAESDLDSSESVPGYDSLEKSHTLKKKEKVLTKENVPPSNTPVSKAPDDQSELSKTNALLHTLLKRIERQDKKISDLQSKLSRSSTISSASTVSTPRRQSASDRRKKVPLEVRRETRRVYNMLSEDEGFFGWKLERGATFRSPENQAVLDVLIKEVKGLNPTFSTQHINDAAYRFYRTKCEEDSIKRRGKSAEKQQKKRARERLIRKLAERKTALETVQFSRENDKLLWEKVLIVEFMSSEESDLDDEEEVLTLHPLPWRAGKVDALFRKLDEITIKAKSPQARRQMKKRVLGPVSSRTYSSDAGIPSWAVVLD